MKDVNIRVAEISIYSLSSQPIDHEDGSVPSGPKIKASGVLVLITDLNTSVWDGTWVTESVLKRLPAISIVSLGPLQVSCLAVASALSAFRSLPRH